MAATLPRPGVEVIQVFRSVSPTIIRPTLVPSIVGVAKQLVSVLETDAAGTNSLNSDALINLPAFFLAIDASGDPKVYSALDTKSLVVSVNNGTDITVTFADTAVAGLTPATVVSQVLASFAQDGVTSLTAKVIGDAWQLATVGRGDFQSIKIQVGTDPEVLAAFGIGLNKTYTGVSSYRQFGLQIPQVAFPDPRGNLNELAIEEATIRIYLATGNAADLTEMQRDSAFLDNGQVKDQAITAEGSVNLVTTFPGTLDTKTVILAIDGGADVTGTFASPADAAAVLNQLNAVFEPDVTASLGIGTPNGLVFTHNTFGLGHSIEIKGGTANADLGITPATVAGKSIEAVDDGNGDVLTPLLKFVGADFDATPNAATIIGTGGVTLTADGTIVLSDGRLPQVIDLLSGDTITVVAGKINDVMGAAAGGKLLAEDDGGQLRFTHTDLGTDSIINIIGGSALVELGHAVGVTYATARSLPEPGDELWIDGAFVGYINQVAPGADDEFLKLDRQVPISQNVGFDWYIRALSLPGAANRPDPELIVGTNGDAIIKEELLRDITGVPVNGGAGTIYLSYRAVRLDVTQAASQPGLLRFNSAQELEDALEPITTDNPLGLGLFFAIVNGPGIEVTGLGVDEISADAPYGTVDGFTRAAEYLEAYEVYAITPLTHDKSVAEVYKTHVDFMSEPSNKGERVCIWNPDVPDRGNDTLVGSGTNGNSYGAGGTQFDTGISNLSALVLNAGINPVGTIPATDNLFLDIGTDDKNYSIQSISGSVVTIRTVFASGENDDGFYSETDLNDPPLPATLIEEAFSVKVRGDLLLTGSGQPDLTAIAETVQGIGQAFGDRRLWMTIPDQTASSINGLETSIEGFYMNAGIAGMIGQQPPQQSFTNFPMVGYTQVNGSNDTFSDRQLDIMAAGGAYIIVQDEPGAPLIARMALTTDMTSIETRTDSITKVVDFTAKFLRKGLRNYIGRFNITTGFLDTLGTTIEGLLGFLTETGVLIGANLNNIIQDEDQRDTVLVDVTLDVPYPCNYIRLTLVI